MKPTSRLTPGTLALVAFSVSMSVGAQLSLSHGMSGLGANGATSALRAGLLSPWVLAGIGMYGLGTVTWLVVLSRIDLVVAYPLGSLNFVFVTLLAALVLREEVPALRWLGTSIILSGILLVAWGERASASAGVPGAGPDARHDAGGRP